MSTFVLDECEKRLNAYKAQPRDAVEHFETENEVLSGGYAYRQLYELIQNAADAILEAGETHGRICVQLSPTLLEAANTGAALDEGGIVALLNARSSSKRGNQIGRFGIGFKSLLKLGGRVDVLSRSVGLRFDPEACRNRIRAHLGLSLDDRAPGMRLAEVLDPFASGNSLSKDGNWSWATTVVSAQIAETSTFQRLSEELENFPPEFLLFLPANISLELLTEGKKPRIIHRRIEENFAIVNDGTSETKWKVFETKVNIQNRDALSDATHIQARNEVPLTWAVPVGGRDQAGRFWAFFPTETQSRTSGILNAPWKLNSDRTNLIRGPWNDELMKAAARLIASSLPELATPDDLGAAVSAFPRQTDRLDDIAAPLVRAMWDHILVAKILPDANGVNKRVSNLVGHFIENSTICKTWQNLADTHARQNYLHPDCFSSEARSSRLNALRNEALKKSFVALRKDTAESWLECIGSTDADTAKQVLAFVGTLLAKRFAYNLPAAPEARLILTVDGDLVTPSKAIVLTGATAAAGFHAVHEQLAADPECRRILVEALGVKILAADSWNELLKASYDQAVSSEEPEDWEHFWQNIVESPPGIGDHFLRELSLHPLSFRTVSGSWRNRQLLIVSEETSEFPEDYVVDIDFLRSIKPRTPQHWLTEFPPEEEFAEGRDVAFFKYRQWAMPHFDEVCREKTGSTPRNMPRIENSYIRMPGGWRLLSHLQGKHASRLTSQILRGWNGEAKTNYKINLIHPTQSRYPQVPVPTPLYHCLTESGFISVGSASYPIRSLSPKLIHALSKAGIAELDDASRFLHSRDADADFEKHFSWLATLLHQSERAKLWSEIFGLLALKTHGYRDLRAIWELASAERMIPAKVPTSGGPISLQEIFVTSDPAFDHLLDDGTVVFLSESAASNWTNSGAKALGLSPKLSFASVVPGATRLADIMPGISIHEDTSEKLKAIHALWVNGLTSSLGTFNEFPALEVDSDGTLLIDQERFTNMTWAERARTVLRCLARHDIIAGGEYLERLLEKILDRRTEEARKLVRSEPTLERRLLKAVNGDVEALFDVMTAATREAAGNDLDPEAVARLALAVHGPVLLSKLRDILDHQGLAPPVRWTGEQAQDFVLELGFPSEFASPATGRREPELSISGPINLPPLHDYQEDILKSIHSLLRSGTGRRRAVISLPTGGGKTRVAAEAVVTLVLRAPGNRTALWVAQTDELCEQAVQCFRQLWVNVGEPGEDLRVIRLWGGQKNPAAPEGDEATVVIASIQTLNSRFNHAGLAWIARAGIVIIDECHQATTSSYTDLMRWLDAQVGGEKSRERETPILGLSATPWRGYNDTESKRLAARFDHRLLPTDQAGLHEKLSQNGVLAERHYQPLRYDRAIHLTHSEQQHVDRFGELPDSVVERIGEDSKRNEMIVQSVVKSSAKSILLFANSVDHAQLLAAKLHLAGCTAAAVSGQTDRLARQHFTRRFRAGEIRVICNHSVLTTGFDAPKVDLILISRPVFSPVLYMQMVGRGLRGPANGGTSHCEIITVEDNIVSFRDRMAYHFCKRYFDD